MQDKRDDWQRIESVIGWANMNINYFARHIGLSRGENLYQIKRGNNGISRRLADLIVESFPEINQVWLLTGYGEMFVEREMHRGGVGFYDCDFEFALQNIGSVGVSSSLLLPQDLECDFAVRYNGQEQSVAIPDGSVLLLKNIPLKDVVVGSECVVVCKKSVTLRILQGVSTDGVELILTFEPTSSALDDDLRLSAMEIDALYRVQGKILINK